MPICASILRKALAGEISIVPILIGPFCYGLKHVGIMVDYFNFLVAVDRTPVRHPFRSVFQFQSYTRVYKALPIFIKYQGWHRVAIFSETYQLVQIIEKTLSQDLKTNNISITASCKVTRTDNTTVKDYPNYLNAAKELSTKGTRIFIILTGFPTLVACALYDTGMFGPKFVFLWEGVVYFQSNDEMKPENCTEHKLAEILRSSIFITQATPMNFEPDFQDEIGMTPGKFDLLMMAKMLNNSSQQEPDERKTWFQWRATFYSQLVGTVLVVNRTNEKLVKLFGSNISEWLTTSENFQNNASFIRNLLHQEFSHFKYKGLNTFGTDPITKQIVTVGFHQMQQQQNGDFRLDNSSSALKPVPVAIYKESSVPDDLLMVEPFQWKTRGNKIPTDSVEKVTKFLPFLPPVTKYSILGLSIFALFLSIVTAIVQVKRIKFNPNPPTNQEQSTRKFNILHCVGIGFAAIFNMIITLTDFPSQLSYSAALVVLIFSQWLLNSAILTKLEIARQLFDEFQILRRNAGKSILKRLNRRHVRHFYRTRFQLQQPTSIVSRTELYCFKFIITSTLIFSIAVIVWLIIDPISMEEITISNRLQTDQDGDFFIEEKTTICHLNQRTANAFFIVFIVPFSILLIRIMQVGYMAKYIGRILVPEISNLRSTAYLTASITLLGIVAILLLFTSSPWQTVTATLALILVIIFINLVFQLKLI